MFNKIDFIKLCIQDLEKVLKDLNPLHIKYGSSFEGEYVSSKKLRIQLNEETVIEIERIVNK